MLEIFGGDAVSIGGVAEDDHVDGFGGEAGSPGLRLGVGVGGGTVCGGVRVELGENKVRIWFD